MVGVADSSSLLVAEDVHSTGLDDALLTQLCAAKSAGSPLSSLLGPKPRLPCLFPQPSCFRFFRVQPNLPSFLPLGPALCLSPLLHVA